MRAMRIAWFFENIHPGPEGVTGVLQGCSKGIARVLQGCYNGVPRKLQGCYKGVTSFTHLPSAWRSTCLQLSVVRPCACACPRVPAFVLDAHHRQSKTQGHTHTHTHTQTHKHTHTKTHTHKHTNTHTHTHTHTHSLCLSLW
jgi:hypothetical protein